MKKGRGREKGSGFETRSEAACFPVSNGEIPEPGLNILGDQYRNGSL